MMHTRVAEYTGLVSKHHRDFILFFAFRKKYVSHLHARFRFGRCWVLSVVDDVSDKIISMTYYIISRWTRVREIISMTIRTKTARLWLISRLCDNCRAGFSPDRVVLTDPESDLKTIAPDSRPDPHGDKEKNKINQTGLLSSTKKKYKYKYLTRPSPVEC